MQIEVYVLVKNDGSLHVNKIAITEDELNELKKNNQGYFRVGRALLKWD